jgi:NTP pyrophosphatase (non-canonical NTP hydrolase)
MTTEKRELDGQRLNDLTVAAHEWHRLACEKGFHDTPAEGRLAEMVLNAITELTELWQAYRKGELHKQCDKATPAPLTYLEEELADTLIRVSDIAVALKVDLARACEVKHEFNKTRPYKHGKVA